MGRNAEAITVFTRLTEDFPELPEPYNNLAVLYAQQKQYNKARTALEMAIRTHPSYAVAHSEEIVYAKLASQAYDKGAATRHIQQGNAEQAVDDQGFDQHRNPPATKPAPASPRAEGEPKKTVATEPLPAPAKKDEVTMPAPAPAAPCGNSQKTGRKAAGSSPRKAGGKQGGRLRKTIGRHRGRGDQARGKLGQRLVAQDVRAYLSFYAKDFETPECPQELGSRAPAANRQAGQTAGLG